MADRTEYGQKGLIGVLTPQANTTVEPELWALMQPGWSMITARLVSDKTTMEARLKDYAAQYLAATAQFANAPVTHILAACTGASYLIGAAREDALVNEIQNTYHRPFTTAALAAVAMLKAMQAQRIALLSPYPDALNEASSLYWESRGFSVIAKEKPVLTANAFHPIYATSSAAVLAAYRALSKHKADAILMLGTGMATLTSLRDGQKEQLTPAISCNLALAGAALGRGHPSGWTSNANWATRLPYLLAEI